MTVPSPKGRWKRRCWARARSSARTPTHVSTMAASTSEKGPKVLAISSTQATAATLCSRPSLRQRNATGAPQAAVGAPAAASAIR